VGGGAILTSVPDDIKQLADAYPPSLHPIVIWGTVFGTAKPILRISARVSAGDPLLGAQKLGQRPHVVKDDNLTD
jgi:hypothetical protein